MKTRSARAGEGLHMARKSSGTVLSPGANLYPRRSRWTQALPMCRATVSMISCPHRPISAWSFPSSMTRNNGSVPE